MAKPYNDLKEKLENMGYLSFVGILKWSPDQRPIVAAKYAQIFVTPEGSGVKGVHTWHLMGRDTMIVIGWTNSSISLQKFCASITYGTGITMDVCPAIDHFGLTKALGELKARFPEIPVPKAVTPKSKALKRRDK